ncbi:hypothetical protein M378DRAFT_1059162, partial [Amanita muscaria Koide BX008]
MGKCFLFSGFRGLYHPPPVPQGFLVESLWFTRSLQGIKVIPCRFPQILAGKMCIHRESTGSLQGIPCGMQGIYKELQGLVLVESRRNARSPCPLLVHSLWKA